MTSSDLKEFYSPAPGRSTADDPRDPPKKPAPGQTVNGTGEIIPPLGRLDDNPVNREAREAVVGRRGLIATAGDRRVAALEVVERIRGIAGDVHATGLGARRHIVRAERLIELFRREHAMRVDAAAAGIEREAEAARRELERGLRAQLPALCGDGLGAGERARLLELAAGVAARDALLEALAGLVDEPALWSSLSPEQEFAGRVERAAAALETARQSRERIGEFGESVRALAARAAGLVAPFVPRSPADADAGAHVLVGADRARVGGDVLVVGGERYVSLRAVDVRPAARGLEHTDVFKGLMADLDELAEEAGDALERAHDAEAEAAGAVPAVEAALAGKSPRKRGRQ